MKKYIYLPLFFLFTYCSNNENNLMILNLKVDGFKKGKIFLQKINDSTIVNIDSTYVENDDFLQFKHKIKSPEIFYVALDISKNDNMIEFFGEKGEITIESNLKKFNSEFNVSGSFNDSIYRNYLNVIKKFNYEKLDLIKSSIKFKKDNKLDSLDLVENEIKSIEKRKFFYSLNFAVNNGNSAVAPYVAITNFSNSEKLILDTIIGSLEKEILESKYGKILSDLKK